jgi:AraC family transcriptional regulator
MTPQRLRRIDELIEARLETRLTVQDLAEAIGLSTGFFTRAFKRATGRAPHDTIIDRRIARARLLLRNRGLGLAAVALASGFASHAHMTATFHSRLGISPRSLR